MADAYKNPIVIADNDVNAAFTRGEDSFGNYPTPKEAQANAALIIHRVNTYEQIVEALQCAAGHIGGPFDGIEDDVPDDARVDISFKITFGTLRLIQAALEAAKRGGAHA